jgi:hypothetical protein
MRCFRDAQYDTIADRRDSDVKNYNGWRSLPIVNSGGFARCAAFVRSVCGICAARVRRLCGRVRLCAVVCGCVRLYAVVCGCVRQNLPSQIGTTSKLTTSVELANDVGAPC